MRRPWSSYAPQQLKGLAVRERNNTNTVSFVKKSEYTS